MQFTKGVKLVAAFEAAKGALVLLAGFGLLSLVHHDIQHLAERVVARFHLNPGRGYPHIFLQLVGEATSARLWWIAVGAAAYALVRFVEAYGLWRERRWAEWFAAVSGAIYLPFEIYELARGVTNLKIALFTINAAIVVCMCLVLAQRPPGASSHGSREPLTQ